MNWNTILIYVAIAFGGYLLGLLDRWITDRMRKSRAEKAEPAVPVSAGPPDALRMGSTPDGLPYVELDGTRLSPADMTPEQRRRLINLLVQVRPWVEGPAAPAPAPTPPPAGSDHPGRPIVPVEAPAKPARIDLVRGMRQFMEDAVIKKDPGAQEEAGIVGLINAVLQRKLEGSPLAKKDIRLTAAPDGSVIVIIGTQRFAGVDAVPDPDVKALIRAAIAEWEQTGGR